MKKTTLSLFEKAVNLIDNGHNIFITGGGGVGKSWLLKKLKEHYDERLHLTSTTGVSALNIGGQTIHSWAFIGTAEKDINDIVKGIKKNQEVLDRIKNCELLAIDEVSMLSDYLINYLDLVLKTVRKSEEPFGGIQVIFIEIFFNCHL